MRRNVFLESNSQVHLNPRTPQIVARALNERFSRELKLRNVSQGDIIESGTTGVHLRYSFDSGVLDLQIRYGKGLASEQLTANLNVDFANCSGFEAIEGIVGLVVNEGDNYGFKVRYDSGSK